MNRHSDIEFFLRIEPDVPKLTHQNGVKPAVLPNGKPFMHKTRELENLEAKFVSLLADKAPEKPWKCPIHLTTAWHFRRPKSQRGVFKTTKPDTDNLVKTLKDCMKTAGYFVDDALVALDTIAKYWVDDNAMHGIHIRMHDLTDENKTQRSGS